ncbi:penicillin-binding transpeptidase domain-containing protein [Verrucomicrobiota bacterium sgz303538]
MNFRISTVLFGSAFAGMVLLTLLDTAAKGFAVFAVAILVALTLRRASAATRHLVWASALICALALPFCAWFLPQWRVLPAWMSWEEMPRRIAVAAPVAVVPEADAAPVVLPVLSASDDAAVNLSAQPGSFADLPAPAPAAGSRIRVDAHIVVLGWLGGAALVLGPLFYSLVSLWRVGSRAREITDGPLAGKMHDLQRELGFHRRIRLLLGEADAMPMVWGIFRPRLLLPSSAMSWEASRLRGVLLHELAHLRRRDPLSMLIAQLALAVHWFNPLAWIAVRQLRVEQERACDDYVLSHGVRASDYASDLLAVATGLRGVSFASAALTMAHPARLEGRIAGILDAARDRRALTRWFAVAVALIASAVVLPLAMLRAEEEKRTEPAKAALVVAAEKRAESASISGVTTTADAAEITVGDTLGSLAFVVGEREQARVIVHQFGGSKAPIVFRVGADDRQGKWWDQVRIARTGEAESLLPVLPDDWLPAGRVVFLPIPTNRADGGVTIAEIETKAGRIPLAVRTATPGEISKAQERKLPRTSPDTEIVFDARLHALGGDAPKKILTLPVMAAQDLVGPPRGALSRPYVTVTPGLPQHWDRMGGRAERVDVTATLTTKGVQLNGSITVAMLDGKYGTAAEAWRHNEDASEAERTALSTKQLRADFSATLGGNDALVVPISSEGLFPETLVASITALPRRVARVHWLPPSDRSPIQVDGWVLTWPRSEHEWFSKQFDYKGIPEMISHIIEKRRNTSSNAIWSEGVGNLRQNEVEKLLEGFRGKTGVSVERVEPFSVKQHLSSWSTPEDRTSFSAAGERGSVLMSVGEQYIDIDLKWESPVLKHVSGSVSYGMHSGTSVCALLPGPAEPETIRMIVLRCVDPDSQPAQLAVGVNEAPTPKAASPHGADREKQIRGSLIDRNGVVLAESAAAGARRYPFQTLAVHTLGYVSGGRERRPLEGRAGVERIFDDELKKGEHVRLSLDARLQSVVEKTLREAGIGRGAVVILDPATGELLANASMPNFDANLFVPSVSAEYWKELSENSAAPLLNRGISSYAPGSTFHLVTALAACRAGKADKIYDCTGSITYAGKTFTCLAAHGEGKVGHGRLNLREALTESCNCYFYQLGNEIGIEAIEETAHLLGLGASSGLGLIGENPGTVASPTWLKKVQPAATWTPGYTANAAAGHGLMSASPVQIANVVAAIANGGRVLAPRLQVNGQTQLLNDLITSGVKTEHLAMLRDIMANAVNTRSGSAAQARTNLISIAGRTGAAQTQRKLGGNTVAERDAWFVGYAPADSPRYAFAVVVEGSTAGVTGGVGPIARRIMEAVASGLPAPEPLPEDKGHLRPIGAITFGAD